MSKGIARHAGDFTAWEKTDGGPLTIAALFEARHGYEPEAVYDGGTVWLAGPLQKNGLGSLKNAQDHTRILCSAENGSKTPAIASSGLLGRNEAARTPLTPERARQLALGLGEV